MDLFNNLATAYGVVDSVTGISAARQRRDQKKMMNHAAGLNELQAKRDYQRQLDMFGKQSDFSREMFEGEKIFNESMLQKQQDYNSAAGQRKRLEDAGLSVGLMMGGGGAGASTSASTSAPSASSGSAPQGQGVSALGVSEKLYGQLMLDSARLSLEGQKLENEKKQVEINEAKADADIAKVTEDTKISAEKAKQEMIQTKIDKDFAWSLAKELTRTAWYKSMIADKEHGIKETEAEFIEKMKDAEYQTAISKRNQELSNEQALKIKTAWIETIDKYGLNKELIELLPYLSDPIIKVLTSNLGVAGKLANSTSR
jgi:hypothetical protein